MPINLGSTAISKAYVGSTAVDKIYVGATEVWSNAVVAPGRMRVGTNFQVGQSWTKVTTMISSGDYPNTTTIVDNCLIVPATGSYTLTGGAVFTGSLGTQIARAVLQTGTVLAADTTGSSPSVIPSTVVSLTVGDQIRLEAQGSVNQAAYQTISANVNSYIQIVPVS
ncbi:hypothetical protein [Rhodococcoides fascians]|uniref:hypothetical protein n=1 Tax=Rhodococcoides fascians TaxID=1828 RepID=UPI0012D2D353|nr:hypothetical protein [Rhodococcus fascians]